jgi:hypothetical protein
VKTMQGDTPLTLNWRCYPSLVEKLGLHRKSARHLDALTGVVGALLTSSDHRSLSSLAGEEHRPAGSAAGFRPFRRFFTAALHRVRRPSKEIDRSQRAAALLGLTKQTRARHF